MTVVGKSWSRLTLPGKIIFTALPILLLLGLTLAVAVALFGGPILETLAANEAIVRFVVAVTIVLLMTIPTAFLIIFMEMKVIALMNLRIGPDRVGPFGTLLSVVHGLKVLMKEDFTPTGADPLVFTWAPVVTYLASVMTLLVIPFAPGLFGQDLNLGLLYFFAIGGLSVVGLLMAGWSSYNKYSLLGGLRAAAQVISYEIPLTLSVVGIILVAGTMSLNQIVELQGPTRNAAGEIISQGWFTDWFVFRQPLGFLIFFIAATAEANRTPFDLTEADSEIVAGFATEYSGMRFGFFFFAEYVNVFIISALTVVLFFGGWNSPIDPRPILDFFHGSVGLPWAWSIVALTVLVRILLVPLTVRQIHSMQSLQAHAPEMKAIQQKYKGDRTKLNEELMKFYKENHINPAASCLPLLAQFPVFIALYFTLKNNTKHITGSWLHVVPNIADKGTAHWSGYVLLAVYAGSQVASTYFMGATMDKTQRTIMMFLPLVFLTVVSRFPTGLILYWMTTNLWTVGQGLVTRRLVPKPGSLPAVPAGPKRTSRNPPKEEPAVANGAKAAATTPKQPPAQPRRVKKKGRAKR